MLYGVLKGLHDTHKLEGLLKGFVGEICRVLRGRFDR